MNDTTYDIFEKNYNQKKSQIISKEFVGDLETPISTLLKLSVNQKYSFLLESVEGGKQRGRFSLLGIDPDIIWECKNNETSIFDSNNKLIENFNSNINPFQSLRNLLIKSLIPRDPILPPFPVLVGYIGYPMIKFMEEIKLSNNDIIGIPDSIFIRPKLVLVFDNITDKIFLMSPIYFSEKICAKDAYEISQKAIKSAINNLNTNLKKDISINLKNKFLNPISNFTRNQYSEIIKKAKKYINEGDIFQVVTSQRFEMDYDLSAISLYRSLRRLNPSPFLVNLNFNDFGLVASSPEILVRLRNNKVTIRPIAGTRPRGLNINEDMNLAKDLLSDKKELAEHLMLLDLGRNDVGRISKIGSVKVTEKMIIEYYSHVMHIVSNVEGIIDEKYDAIDALIAGFPAGTVSGAPKIRAMEIIEELENHSRSFYGGAMGYFDSNGQMDTCISLRTGLVKDKKLFVQAGGGIVYDSDEEKEYQETIDKAKAVIKAAEESYKFLENS